MDGNFKRVWKLSLLQKVEALDEIIYNIGSSTGGDTGSLRFRQKEVLFCSPTFAERKKIVNDGITAIVHAGKVAGAIPTELATARRDLSRGVSYLVAQAMHFIAPKSRTFLTTAKE